MTCIVGVMTNNAIYLGADSAVSGGDQIHILIDKKIFVKGPYGIGFAGSLRVGQLIKHRMRTPTVHKAKIRNNPVQVLAVNFVDAMRKCLKEGGASRETDAKEEEQENSFVITFRNRLFVIDAGYSVCEINGNCIAIGSGSEYALGSLHTTEEFDMTVKERIEAALEAASFFSATVAPPFEIIKIPHTKL